MKQLRFLALTIVFLFFCSHASFSQNAIDSLKGLSDLKYYSGNYKEALRIAWLLEERVKNDSTENSREYAIATGMYLAMNYEKLKQYDSAAFWYMHSIDIYRMLNDTSNISYGETLANAGNLFWKLSIYENAISLLNKAVVVLKDADPHVTDGEGAAINNLANCYAALGINNSAEIMYLASLDWIKNKMPEIPQKQILYATVLNNLSALYKSVGNLNKTSQYADSALALFRLFYPPDSKAFATILSNRSGLYNFCDNADSSISFAGKAIRIFEKKEGTTDPEYFAALNNIAQGYLIKNKTDSTALYLTRACKLAKQYSGESSNEYLSISLNLCSFYDQQQLYNKSDSVLETVYLKVQPVFGPYAEQTLKANTLYASMQIRRGLYTQAAEILKTLSIRMTEILGKNLPGLSENEKLLYMNTLNNSIGVFGALAIKSGYGSAFPVQEFFQQQMILKRLILGQQQKLMYLLQQDNSDKASTLLFKWKREKQLLASHILSGNFQNKYYTDSLEAVIELTERKISRLYPDLPAESFKTKADADLISNSLKTGEAAIEFIHFDVNSNASTKRMVYAAFLIRPGISKPLFIPLFDEQQLITLLGKEGIEKFSRGELVQKIYTSPANKNEASLYKLIWKPLEKYLANYKLVFYSPVGLLNTIAMHAIPVGQNKFLYDIYQLRCVSSINNIASGSFENADKPRDISLWGDFNYDLYKKRSSSDAATNGKASNSRQKNQTSKLDSIPFSKIEVEYIETLFINKGLVSDLKEKEEATEDIFKQKVNGAIGVLHVSTHGFFTEFRKSNKPLSANASSNRSDIYILSGQQNPLFRSGLAFSGANHVYGGNEPFHDIDDGILTGYEISLLNLKHVQLVTLSACKTGVGDIRGNEGVFGLLRAFFLAGANKILMSYWPVPDKETSGLMMAFYENWLNGIPMHEALDKARAAVRKQHPHPYYWAGFVLME